MGFAELVYLFLALPCLSWALTAWARWARGLAGPRTLALGVVLAAVGIDGLRQILRKASFLPPVWWAEPAIFMLVGGFLFYAFLRAWRSLDRPRQRTGLEDLVEEASAADPG